MTTTFIAVTIFFTFAFAIQFLMYRRLKNDLSVAVIKLTEARMDFNNLNHRTGRINSDIERLFISRCTHASRLEVLEDAIIRCNTDVIHGVLTVTIRTPKSQPNKESV